MVKYANYISKCYQKWRVKMKEKKSHCQENKCCQRKGIKVKINPKGRAG